jgi:hypothetical protein
MTLAPRMALSFRAPRATCCSPAAHRIDGSARSPYLRGKHEVRGVATQFGIAKCRRTTVYHSVIDGVSLNVALGNANLSPDCGRAFFKVFDAYIDCPNPTALNRDQVGVTRDHYFCGSYFAARGIHNSSGGFTAYTAAKLP